MDISAFIELALCYSSPPELNVVAHYKNYTGSAFSCEDFINELRRFYLDTDFDCFYKNSQNEYNTILNSYLSKTKIEKYITVITRYLQTELRNYTIILSPLIMRCYGLTIYTIKNEQQHYSIISPSDYKESKYVFGSVNVIKEYIWHEISHLTINDVTKRYIHQFDAFEKQIPETLVHNFYIDRESIVNEYIIISITIRLFEIQGENKFIEYLVKNNIQQGFKNIEVIKNYISENYEENNTLIKDCRYKNLVEYIINKI